MYGNFIHYGAGINIKEKNFTASAVVRSVASRLTRLILPVFTCGFLTMKLFMRVRQKISPGVLIRATVEYPRLTATSAGALQTAD